MIHLRQDKNLYGVAGTDNVISYVIKGTIDSNPGYIRTLAQGNLSSTISVLIYRNDNYDKDITSVVLTNTSASTVSGVTFYIGHSLLYKEEIDDMPLTIPAYGSALYINNAWQVYDSNNLPYPTGGVTDAIIMDYTAGATVNGNRVVMLDNNTVIHADPSDETNYNTIIGISKNSGILGETINVVTFGELDSFSSLVPDDIYYCAATGTITNIVPITGILVEVGVALTTTKLHVNLNHEFITI